MGERFPDAESPAAFRRLAWSAAAATFGLMALGGIVRVTGSGLGCGDDWPLCRGGLLPPLELPALIEYAHRLAASLVSVLVLSLAGLAWLRHRRQDELRGPATVAAALLLAQVLLGAVTVRLGLPPGTVVLHLATAMALLAALTIAALRASHPWRASSTPAAGKLRDRAANRPHNPGPSR